MGYRNLQPLLMLNQNGTPPLLLAPELSADRVGLITQLMAVHLPAHCPQPDGHRLCRQPHRDNTPHTASISVSAVRR